MILLFITSYVLVTFLLVFFIMRRRVDVFFVAFIGSIFYFLPALLPSDKIYEQTIIVYWVYLTSLVAGSVLFDLNYKGKGVRLVSDVNKVFYHRMQFFLALLSVSFLLAQVVEYGILDFFTNKQSQERGGYLSTLYAVFVLLGFSVSLFNRVRAWIALFSVLLLFMFVSGSRTQVVISFFCLLVYWGTQGGEFKKIFGFWSLVALLSILILGVYGKDIYAAISYTVLYGGNYFENLIFISSQNGGGLILKLKTSEPFWIDQMFGKIMVDGLVIDPSYLLGLPLQFLPFSGAAGGDLHYFSNTIKYQYFSHWGDSAGVGATYLGEGYANFGIVGLVFYIILANMVLYLLNVFIRFGNAIYSPLLSVLAAYWCFYIHRNSLFQMISHTKKYVYVYLLICVILILINKRAKRTS